MPGVHKKVRRWAALVGLVCMVGTAGWSRSSYALSSDVRAVFVASGYGAAGGTLMGLLAWPFTHQVRSVFMGTSVGLYLGIVVGFFYVTTKDDPTNPLSPRAGSVALMPIEFQPTRTTPPSSPWVKWTFEF